MPPRELWTNRYAALVKPTSRFRDWLITVRGHASAPIFYEKRVSVYLVDRKLTLSEREAELRAKAPQMFSQELFLNDVDPAVWPDVTDHELFLSLFSVTIANLDGDLGSEPFSAGSSAYHPNCYCGLWDKKPEVLEAQGLPRGFCGVCSVCGKPGHARHHPGDVPFTGSWCDEHFQELAERRAP